LDREPSRCIFQEPPKSISTKSGGAVRTVLSGFGKEAPQYQVQLIKNKDEIAQLARAHAKWDTEQSSFYSEWLQLLSSAAEAKKIVEERLTRQKTNIVLLRLAQDVSDEKERAEVCLRIKEYVKAEGSNADLQYLLDRCIEDRAERHAAYRRDFQRWPDNAWFTYVDAYRAIADNDWTLALSELNTAAQQLPIMREDVMLEEARILRLTKDMSNRDLRLKFKGNPRLQYFLTLESSDVNDAPAFKAYRALERGELNAAINAVETVPELKARVLRLAAASSGADDKIKQRAFALAPDEGVDFATVWSTIGLALKEHRDHTAYWGTLKAISPGELANIQRFIELIVRRDLNGAQAAIRFVTPEIRAHLYSMGVVYLGNQAPANWRAAAKHYLFASEHPTIICDSTQTTLAVLV